MKSLLLILTLLLVPNFPKPNGALTPGAVLTSSASKVCVRGYAKTVRNVPQSEKNAVYASYGIKSHKPHEFEVDHLISLELGGSNEQKNLWPQPYPGAYSKDSLENALHAAVCSKRIPLDSAQRWIARDWVSAYRAMKKGEL
jgi:hypothetical protein